MLAQHEYIMKSLRAHNVRHGHVLILGHDPKPLTDRLNELGFNADGFTLNSLRNMLRDAGTGMNDFKKTYDIIVLDDLLQFLACPHITIRTIKTQLSRGGILVITCPNVARGSMRLRALIGKNIYPRVNDSRTCESAADDQVKIFYREYTLDETRSLLSEESFIFIDAGFFNNKINSDQYNFILKRFYQLLQNVIPSFRNYLFLIFRGNFTEYLPTITKDDPFKRTSMHVFNYKWISTYNSTPLFKQFFINRWDEAVLKHLPDNISLLRILDIGCGWGRLLTLLADAGARHLAGMDLAPRMIDLVRQRLIERGIRADMKVGDAEDNIPWEDESFDVITLTGSFHHFYRPHDALQEIHRVLRKNGILIIADPWFFPPLRQILNYLCSFKVADGDYRFYTAQEISVIVASTGFTLSHKQHGVNSLLVTGLKQS